jgi:DNA-binding GntR family transcriptional regulator
VAHDLLQHLGRVPGLDHQRGGRVAQVMSAEAIAQSGPGSVPGVTDATWLDATRENILAEAGYEQVYDIDEIITRMPTPAEIERLRISTGTPVAEHIRTGYTAADKPVRVMISIIPGDTLILQYTIPT